MAGVYAERLQVMPEPLERARDYYTRRAIEQRTLAVEAAEDRHRDAHLMMAKRYELYAEWDLSPPLQAVD